MKCQSCGAEKPPTARFCPSCGADGSMFGELKAPNQVTLDWLEPVLAQGGYRVQECMGQLLAIHEERGLVVIGIAGAAISILHVVKIRRPGWMRKHVFLEALNRANGLHSFLTFSSLEPFDCVRVTTFFHLSERTAARDITNFLSAVHQGIGPVLSQSGLAAFR